jgi:DNA sulfur modification protein DndB
MNTAKLILPCLRGVVGDWVYYSTLMTAEQISNWIKTAKDIREAKSLDEELQRDLKERKKQIAKYLLSDNSRFFNSIIVGIFDGIPDWREFDLSKAQEEYSDQFNSAYFKESLGLMVFNGDEKMFAIDGQHRVAGIQMAYDEDCEKDVKDQILTDDQYSVIFVAHVDDCLGMKRTRKLFSDINKNAKPVAKRDKIIIDEQEIAAIVTRRVFAEYSHFDEGQLIALSESTNLESDDTAHFTNITNLYDVVKILYGLYKIPKGTNEWDEENIVKFKSIVFNFLDKIIEHKKEYKEFFILKTKTLSELRVNNAYLLFRPVGFTMIAKLFVEFAKRKEIDFFFDNIDKISYIFPYSPFNKIIWNNGKMDVKSGSQTLMVDLTLYLLRKYNKDTDDLLRRLRDITKNDYIELPNPINTD